MLDRITERCYVSSATLFRNNPEDSPVSALIYRSELPSLPPLEPIPSAFSRLAATHPDAIAVVDGATGAALSRAELAHRSAAFAALLRERGIGTGDLVAIAAPNLAAWPVAALGAWRSGSAVAALSPLWTADEMARLVALVRPRLAVAFDPLADVVSAALDRADLETEVMPTSTLDSLLETAPQADAELDLGALAAVPFSSGTGGLPKGVRLTHRNLAAGASHTADSFSSVGEFGPDSVMLAGAPFFHAVGLSLSLAASLARGARLVTVPRPELGALLELVEAHGVTHMAVPPQIVDALAYQSDIRTRSLSSLRLVATGGTHVPAASEDDASRRLDAVVRQGYGLTETTCIIAAPHREPSTPGTVGWLAADTEARLVDPETGRDQPEGEPGELWVRGPQVMEGYHGAPEETVATLTTDGWLRTGDLVAIRPDGQLEIRGRLKELIKVRASSVAPAEVELVLREHPAVADAGVVGVPDPETGEAPMAFAVLSGPADAGDLMAWAAERLAEYKRPRDVQIVESVPRLPTGKLQRNELRQMAGSRRTPRPNALSPKFSDETDSVRRRSGVASRVR
jgi:acyl-CoA synthetase (AMP-forming)/AMP-acid ligase II